MFCSKCGTQNDDTGAFCISCGSALAKPPVPPTAPPMQESQQQPPPMREPLQQQPMTAVQKAAPTPSSKPYKAEFTMGLIGSIIGAVLFLVLIIVGASSWWFGELVIGGSMFVLASFILGFVGTGQLNRGKGSGGILLTIGGGLGFIAMFFGIWISWITIFYFPLLLTGGIMALARKRSVERNSVGF